MPSMRFAARSVTRPPFPPDHQHGYLSVAWLALLTARRNPTRQRSNPRQAKRSHDYPRKPADRAKRPVARRGALTLVLLPRLAIP